jgi:hypothetical protein
MLGNWAAEGKLPLVGADGKIVRDAGGNWVRIGEELPVPLEKGIYTLVTLPDWLHFIGEWMNNHDPLFYP